MTASQVVLTLVGVGVLARMALSLYRIGRGVSAARSELAVWRDHHSGRHQRREADGELGPTEHDERR